MFGLACCLCLLDNGLGPGREAFSPGPGPDVCLKCSSWSGFVAVPVAGGQKLLQGLAHGGRDTGISGPGFMGHRTSLWATPVLSQDSQGWGRAGTWGLACSLLHFAVQVARRAVLANDVPRGTAAAGCMEPRSGALSPGTLQLQLSLKPLGPRSGPWCATSCAPLLGWATLQRHSAALFFFLYSALPPSPLLPRPYSPPPPRHPAFRSAGGKE